MHATFNEEDLNTFKTSVCTLIRTIRSLYNELRREMHVELLEEKRRKSSLLIELEKANTALNHLCYLDVFKEVDICYIRA